LEGDLVLPLIVVVVVFTVLTVAGAAGVSRLRDWRLSLRIALAVMLFITASAHWGAKRADLVAMVPPLFPNPELLVTLTGIAEIAGALGLLYARTVRPAAIALAILLAAMFPANIHAAQQGLTIGGRPVTELPLRTAVQIGLIAALAAVAYSSSSSKIANRTRTSLITTSSSDAGSM
jgi:uncharacterized membrane protein